MSRRDVGWAIAGILIVFFAAMLAMNIVVTALPVIVGDLDGTQIQYSWVVAATLLANASSTPVWGKLADMVSKKRLFQLSNIIFVLSSLAAGFAVSMEMLIAARFVQGIGLGGLGALAMAIMASIVSPRERGRYAGYIGAVLTTATAAGPLIGGLTVDTIGWRWCFFVGVPLSLVALVLVHRTLKLPHVRRKVRMDYVGALLLVTASSLLLMWLSFAGTPEFFDWVSWESGLLLAGVAVILTAFVLVERRSGEPVVALRMLISRTTLLAVISSASIAVCLFGMPAFLGQYFQIGRGLSPTASGMMILPLVVGNLIGSLTSGRLITRYGRWKIYLVIGSLLLSSAMFGLSTVDSHTDLRLVMGIIFIVGLGFGAQMQNLMLAVQNTVAVTRVGQASALVAFFRVFGGAAGTAILGSVMALQVAGISVGQVNGAAGTATPEFADGSGTMFLVAACMTLPAVVANLLIRETPLRTTI
ncbi:MULTISPECIES: MFS transporter [Actinomycetes]|uniref:MDR family MFS transporter n=2 Tax=Actinomycetes TaxID=1760 RepID=A0ABP6LT79_9MICC|nr:MFS transporter [Nesterenkonia sp. PF2B19]